MTNEEMKVRIFDMEHGLVEYENVKTIRIISKDYNLLIMKDYLSIIGEIVGSVDIKGKNVDLSFKQIKAFYMNSKNVVNDGTDNNNLFSMRRKTRDTKNIPFQSLKNEIDTLIKYSNLSKTEKNLKQILTLCDQLEVNKKDILTILIPEIFSKTPFH